MSTDSPSAAGLDAAIAELYRGPLDDFVRRRDALAKELRAAGNRDAGATVKSLRKPSRMAWALDLAAQGSIDGLIAAVADTLAAQTAGGDVRAAMMQLRTAVRTFADAAAHAAVEAGQRIEAAALANAVLAVLGKPESFNQLRAGHLADIPEAGGLDFLTALPASLAQVEPGAVATPRADSSASVAADDRPTLESAARAAARQASVALAAARERAEKAARTLRAAESKLQAAEQRLRDAEEAASAARQQRERARDDAERAAAELRDAEAAVAVAEREVDSGRTSAVERA